MIFPGGFKRVVNQCITDLNDLSSDIGAGALTERDENLVNFGFSKGAEYAARVMELFIKESKRTGTLARVSTEAESSDHEELVLNLQKQMDLIRSCDLSDPLVRDDLIRLSNELQYKIINGR
jgi:surfactin synthase thioesterase subunit